MELSRFYRLDAVPNRVEETHIERGQVLSVLIELGVVEFGELLYWRRD
jgi:hypothetical protein